VESDEDPLLVLHIVVVGVYVLYPVVVTYAVEVRVTVCK